MNHWRRLAEYGLIILIGTLLSSGQVMQLNPKLREHLSRQKLLNTKTMSIEYIRYKVALDQRESFVEAYKRASEELAASEFCLAYELSECEEEPGRFVLRIEWTTTEEHLNGFRKSNLFPSFYSKVKPFIANIQEMRHYQLTPVVLRKTK
jgi:quinol monooxygenase YgiN